RCPEALFHVRGLFYRTRGKSVGSGVQGGIPDAVIDRAVRPIDIKSPSAAAQNHGAASTSTSSETAESARHTAPRPPTAGSATPKATSARSASARSAAKSLFPALSHPLVQFVSAHAKHAHARSVAGNRNRLRRRVRGEAGYGHSGRHDLICS